MERQIVRGWRGQLEDEAAAIRQEIWRATATPVYISGTAPADPTRLVGHKAWFRLQYSEERGAASNKLQELQRRRVQLRKMERIPEQRERERAWGRDRLRRRQLGRSPEDRERKRQSDRFRYENLTTSQRHERVQRKAARRAAQTPEERAQQNEKDRAWRARQSREWHKAQSAAKLRRRHANLDLYRAIERRTKAKNRDQINARRRALRAENPEACRAREQVHRDATRDRRLTIEKAAYARRKALATPGS